MTASNTRIEKHSTLRQAHIDSDHYTLTLLQEASYAGLIDEPTVVRIHTEIMSLLQETIIKYTHGESTSIRAETAERILTSILYSIDAQLKGFSDHEAALNSLKAETIKGTYQKGFDLMSSCIEETKMLYRKIADSKLKVDLYAYNETIDEALPEFFAIYDSAYNAQDTWASMDYPLLFNDIQGSGIFYIKQYLKYLAIENYFCSRFDPMAVDKLLNNYGKVYRIDYRETLINILEILLTNSIFSVLSGNSALELRITKQQHEILMEKFESLDNNLCSSIIDQAIVSLLDELRIDNMDARDYISKYPSLLLPRFISARENNNLMNIVIVDRDKTQSLDILWNEGHRLNDDDFRIMVEQIMECPGGIEKAALINANIQSLGDFIDVLEADCLFNTEYSALFTALGDMELSILMRIVFAEELRIGGADNLRQIVEGKQLDIAWQIEYARFLGGLSPARIKAIEFLIPASLQTNKPSIY